MLPSLLYLVRSTAHLAVGMDIVLLGQKHVVAGENLVYRKVVGQRNFLGGANILTTAVKGLLGTSSPAQQITGQSTCNKFGYRGLTGPYNEIDRFYDSLIAQFDR